MNAKIMRKGLEMNVKQKNVLIFILILFLCVTGLSEIVIVKPGIIDDVLTNPDVGFTTYQRFNGDRLIKGDEWKTVEGALTESYAYSEDLKQPGHPFTTIAYARIYWKFLEPEPGQYNWKFIDELLTKARSRGQSLMLRVAPYGRPELTDVPDWYREIVGPNDNGINGRWLGQYWSVDPENPHYVECFGGFIRQLGKKYDGHPDLHSLDMALVGRWGEGAFTEELTQVTREAIVDCYVESFKKTPLTMMLTDPATNKYGRKKGNVGWRVDCLGDMRTYKKGKNNHMHDVYPQWIIQCGMADSWETAAVHFEACWVMQHWKDEGWDIDYIIEQSLKWHISTFNGKSSPVPAGLEGKVDNWLKRMGYRLALRKFTYPDEVGVGGEIVFTSWWENQGVASCYKKYPVSLRLKGDKNSYVLATGADVRQWMPGDSLYDSSVKVPENVEQGVYQLQIGVSDVVDYRPMVKLAIEGKDTDGWYSLGGIRIISK
jgi:hypothetical protein